MSAIITYPDTENRQADTSKITLDKILQAINEGGGGSGSGSAQMYAYTTTDPTTDGITPTNQNEEAMAYSLTGIGPVYTWDTSSHVWR